MTITLKRHAPLEEIQVETLTGVDGQGKPEYDSPVTIDAYVEHEDRVLRLVGGEEIEVKATVWVDGAQDVLPAHSARLTLENGLVGIVVERVDARTIQSNTVDHVRLFLRKE